jgi:hypothetical protein
MLFWATNGVGPLHDAEFAGLPLKVWVVFIIPVAGLTVLALIISWLVDLVRYVRSK